MINNRQNGRRRGRGGGPRSPNNAPNAGNRQDNRQRGNAAQLLEKYKSLARDAQLSGDRVQTEYYLQFADHYYRVLNEGRARFEEQRRQRDDFAGDDADDQDEVLVAEGVADERDERDEQEERRDYRNGSDTPRAAPQRRQREPQVQAQPEQEREQEHEQEEERISMDALPPAIATESVEPPARAPRRRTRRPRAPEGEAEIAPAA